MKINIFESVIKKVDSPIFLCPNSNVGRSPNISTHRTYW